MRLKILSTGCKNTGISDMQDGVGGGPAGAATQLPFRSLPQAAGAPSGHHQGHPAYAVLCSQEEIPGESYAKPACT
jgi:hypothetical protein